MFELEFKKFKMNKIVKSRRGEAKMFEFEFKGLEIKNWNIELCGGKKV